MTLKIDFKEKPKVMDCPKLVQSKMHKSIMYALETDGHTSKVLILDKANWKDERKFIEHWSNSDLENWYGKIELIQE